MKYRNIAALGIGFTLDCLLGDPPNLPHPVRLVGKQIDFEEGLVRKYVLSEFDGDDTPEGWPFSLAQTERLCGYALLFDVALLSPLVVWGLLKVCDKVHPALALGVESLVCYQLLAARSLRDESMKVHDALEAGPIEQARQAVSMIVGRDTDELDEAGVARAAVETVAENASDGVIAPMLYMAVGGAPAMMLYKAVNTLDSMVGYKNEKYANLGYASAKTDDVLNFVPARVAGALMCAAAGLVGYDAAGAWRVFKRDRLAHSSPNSAHTEAACAGALGVQLGGRNRYFGAYVDKPTIGDADHPVEVEDITRANRLMYATAALGLACASALGFAVGFLRGKR